MHSQSSVPAKSSRLCQTAIISAIALLSITGASTPAHADNEWLFAPYLRADLGYSSTVDDNADLLDATPERDVIANSSQNGARYQIGAGLQLNSFLRTDMTLSYRDGLTEAESYTDADGIANKAANRLSANTFETSNWSTMLNVYVDPMAAAGIKTGAFSPYLQGGIGWSRNKTKDLVFANGETHFGATHNDLAWQVGAGLNYAITDRWKIDLSYRFIDMGEARASKNFVTGAGTPNTFEREARFDLQAHEVLLGLQYQF